MNNKPKQSWGEIQLAIAAVGLTATLVFWNLFSAPQKQKVVTQAEDTLIPPSDATQSPATPTPAFYPVKIIFGGTPPDVQATNANVNVVVQQPAPQPKRRGGGGGGGGGGGTGSSKP